LMLNIIYLIESASPFLKCQQQRHRQCGSILLKLITGKRLNEKIASNSFPSAAQRQTWHII